MYLVGRMKINQRSIVWRVVIRFSTYISVVVLGFVFLQNLIAFWMIGGMIDPKGGSSAIAVFLFPSSLVWIIGCSVLLFFFSVYLFLCLSENVGQFAEKRSPFWGVMVHAIYRGVLELFRSSRYRLGQTSVSRELPNLVVGRSRRRCLWC